ncbi:unnamed protein product [Acanthoscelides obtectus]|uniref:Uncharacterized protein n=1 Tax=Acanthoscelides obtectus TaxID=200917 RepID=A0A9P0KRJ6_ACAOB|nr:unnamed protein product [Acanthoscelides obtectus]CAH1980316.1 unnamed protein product [Acanthoscelides obtectus]CAK1674807.1 hypothetical protein AOBTE_LOCUS29748 [Acanthoscelides obtectus]CAK1674809.1 hypothetical protein AOBTE_LOCUS29749 [Acanthoscelides obtectus]
MQSLLGQFLEDNLIEQILVIHEVYYKFLNVKRYSLGNEYQKVNESNFLQFGNL